MRSHCRIRFAARIRCLSAGRARFRQRTRFGQRARSGRRACVGQRGRFGQRPPFGRRSAARPVWMHPHQRNRSRRLPLVRRPRLPEMLRSNESRPLRHVAPSLPYGRRWAVDRRLLRGIGTAGAMPGRLPAVRLVLEIQRSNSMQPDAHDWRVRLSERRYRHRPMHRAAKLRLPVQDLPGVARRMSALIRAASRRPLPVDCSGHVIASWSGLLPTEGVPSTTS